MVTPVGANVIEHRNLTACTPCLEWISVLWVIPHVFETLRWTRCLSLFWPLLTKVFAMHQGDTRSIFFKDNWRSA